MVRLKVLIGTLFVLIYMFQFLDGAIKSRRFDDYKTKILNIL